MEEAILVVRFAKCFDSLSAIAQGKHCVYEHSRIKFLFLFSSSPLPRFHNIPRHHWYLRHLNPKYLDPWICNWSFGIHEEASGNIHTHILFSQLSATASMESMAMMCKCRHTIMPVMDPAMHHVNMFSSFGECDPDPSAAFWLIDLSIAGFLWPPCYLSIIDCLWIPGD